MSVALTWPNVLIESYCQWAWWSVCGDVTAIISNNTVITLPPHHCPRTFTSDISWNNTKSICYWSSFNQVVLKIRFRQCFIPSLVDSIFHFLIACLRFLLSLLISWEIQLCPVTPRRVLKCKPLCHQNYHVDCDLDVLFSSKQKYLSDKSKALTYHSKRQEIN